jgi:peptidoglycan-associated lipoprotein
MKNNKIIFLLAAGCMAYMANGCAQLELVKKYEPIAQAMEAKTSPIEIKEVADMSVKPVPVQETTIHESARQAFDKRKLQAALEKIYFGFNSYELSDAARTSLARNSALFKRYSAIKVRIEGNCDESGSAEYNLALGEKRAIGAKRYLEMIGIPASSISTISYGKEKPANPGHNETAWAKNRRDEFVIE